MADISVKNTKIIKRPSNNPQGRPKGSANLITKEMRTVLKQVVSSQLNELPGMIEALPVERRLDVLLKLLPYIMPKVDAVKVSYGEPFEDDDFPFTRDYLGMNSD